VLGWSAVSSTVGNAPRRDGGGGQKAADFGRALGVTDPSPSRVHSELRRGATRHTPRDRNYQPPQEGNFAPPERRRFFFRQLW